MKICDRTWARDRVAVLAHGEVIIDHQVFHLCAEELAAVVEFVVNPEKGNATGRAINAVKNTLGLRASKPAPEATLRQTDGR